ncbi:hypothetical protein ACFYY9_26395 [Streptomyces nigra]|uniref:hypothetical protein n=1 Tax=Streptomyces nigra TaxID=1827580 RepID=UPI003677868E
MSLTLLPFRPSSDAEYRTAMIRRYLGANFTVQVHLLAEAVDYDKANPGAPSLVDELRGASLGDAA